MQVHSAEQYHRQLYALRDLAGELRRRVQNDTSPDFVFTEEMRGIICFEVYFCSENNIKYLTIEGACNCLQDLAVASLVENLGYIETTGTHRVKIMTAAIGCSVSALSSFLHRARSEGLKVVSESLEL